jgi:hypothetical protein
MYSSIFEGLSRNVQFSPLSLLSSVFNAVIFPRSLLITVSSEIADSAFNAFIHFFIQLLISGLTTPSVAVIVQQQREG